MASSSAVRSRRGLSLPPQSAATLHAMSAAFPSMTPMLPSLSSALSARYEKELAARTIQTMWWIFIRKRLFNLLKKTIRAAEHCIGYEILKRVSPLEADLLKEPTVLCKVRFRFAGTTFPPFVVFKIFCNPRGHGSQYITGKSTITSESEAAVEACKLMGYRKYYNQILQDELNYRKYGITDEMDVATIKDYMQYLSLMDETPAHFGGRHNYWRKLSLEDFPRATIVYDIMDYAQSGRMSERLKEELPYLLIKPENEDMYREQLLDICKVRSPEAYFPTALPLRAVRKTAYKSTRRSSRAREKVAKMRKVYTDEKRREERESSFDQPTPLSLSEEEDWEQEAIKLYDWSKTLRTEDILED